MYAVYINKLCIFSLVRNPSDTLKRVKRSSTNFSGMHFFKPHLDEIATIYKRGGNSYREAVIGVKH